MRQAHLHEIPVIIYGIAPRHAAEIGRICETLDVTVSQAEAMMLAAGPHPGFTALVRHAKDLHRSLMIALHHMELDVPRPVRRIAGRTRKRIDELESIERLLQTTKH